jgi:hypothetical protein
MSPLYLYGLVKAPPSGSLGAGLAGEPLGLFSVGGLHAVIGEVAARPAVTPATLSFHDEVVRRLSSLAPALLPARFGECLADERALSEALLPQADRFASALALVEGCVQMTLRVFGEPEDSVEAAPVPEATEPEAGAGPGARYLAARRRAGFAGLPELFALRQDLRPLLRAERIERPRVAGRLLATAHDLVRREDASDYRRTVEAAAEGLAGRKLVVSGPWPAYAFATGTTP